ncbi:AMP deaminase, partial [Dipsacomyces acuminosporus]
MAPETKPDSADSSPHSHPEKAVCEDDERSSIESGDNHPYLTHRSMSKSRFEASQAFISAMFEHPVSRNDSGNDLGLQCPEPQDKSGAGSEVNDTRTSLVITPATPRSILMSQKLGQAHSDAVLPQISPRTTAVHADTKGMSVLNLDSLGPPSKRGTSVVASDAGETIPEKLLDDEVASRRLEMEIRNMMMRTHITNEATELAGMTESKAELKRIGDAFVRCMGMRNKYMGISLQHEADNPKNKPGWKIYPPPPPAAWRNFREPADNVEVEFDMNRCEIPKPDGCVFEMTESGIYQVYGNEELRAAGEQPFTRAPSIREFYMDLNFVLDTISDGPIKTWAFRRLRYLDARWQLYFLLNEREETMQSKMVPHRDLYNVRKVDGHVHLSSAMNQKHLLRFIKYKLKTEPDKPVIVRGGQMLTLRQVFESLNLTAYDLSIDTLDMHAHKGAYHRFDKFSLKYNPIGESRLRTIFMKSDNHINGEYFAQITKE